MEAKQGVSKKHKYSTYALLILLFALGLAIVSGSWDDVDDWLYPEDGDKVAINPLYHNTGDENEYIEHYEGTLYINENGTVYFTTKDKTEWQNISIRQGIVNDEPSQDSHIATKSYVDDHGYIFNGTVIETNHTNVSILHGINTGVVQPLSLTDSGILKMSVQSYDHVQLKSNISIMHGTDPSNNPVPLKATSEGILQLKIISYIEHNYNMEGDINITGNLNVSGCVHYNGGTLGSCI